MEDILKMIRRESKSIGMDVDAVFEAFYIQEIRYKSGANGKRSKEEICESVIKKVRDVIEYKKEFLQLNIERGAEDRLVMKDDAEKVIRAIKSMIRKYELSKNGDFKVFFCETIDRLALEIGLDPKNINIPASAGDYAAPDQNLYK